MAAFLGAPALEHTEECRQRITEATRADPMDVVRAEENERRTAAVGVAQGRRKHRRLNDGDDDVNMQAAGAASGSVAVAAAPAGSSSSAAALPAAIAAALPEA